MWEGGDWLAVWISVKVASLCLVLILVPGVLTGWVLARKKFPGKPLFEALVHAPLVLPPVVTGYLLLIVWGRKGWLGFWLDEWFGLRLSFNAAAAVMAAAVMAFPLLVRAVQLAVDLVDRDLEVAASILGAGPSHIFWKITLPLAMPGVLTGGLLAFVRSLGEFGATMTFAGNIQGETRTLPLAVYTYLQVPGRESSVWFLVSLSVLISLAALLMSEWAARRLRRRLGCGP